MRVPRKYVYKGQFKKNERSGYGRCEWHDGQFYEGMWQNGKMHGPGKYGTLRVSAIWNWNEGSMGNLLQKIPPGVGSPIHLVVLNEPKTVPELQNSYKMVSYILQRNHVWSETARSLGMTPHGEHAPALSPVGSPTARHRSMSPHSGVRGHQLLHGSSVGSML